MRRREAATLEQALRLAEADLRACRDDASRVLDALERVPAGVRILRPDGTEFAANARGWAFAGDRQADALIAETVTDTVNDLAHTRQASRIFELHLPARRTVAVTATALRGGGAVAVIEDVSNRVLLDAVRRDFVANVSHELRTPVGALAVLAETMAGERDPETMQRLASRMMNEAHRAVTLIEDLLDLSRIEANAAPPTAPVRIGAVIAAAVELVDELARSAGVTIDSATIPADLDVLGDERQLVSACRNLLDNAIRYSNRGAHVAVSVTSDAAFVSITVRDEGIGIPARDLDRIFERFYRVDRARSRETGGTGLGLAIVRHVAQNHGGDVSVESVEGTGSAFTMRVSAG